jgi:hypothetical protein
MGQQIPALPYQPGGGRMTAFAANGLFAEAPDGTSKRPVLVPGTRLSHSGEDARSSRKGRRP